MNLARRRFATHRKRTYVENRSSTVQNQHSTSDELGFAAITDRVHVHDVKATILHLLGFDHKKLTYYDAGRDFRLTDVHGHMVKELVGRI
jgi:hypothetical protein